jgi:folate-dependent phosphoribosylglycinamide formyltransferase PurN
MSIILITIPGEQKREFANLLHKKTGNGVSYVIVQKPRKVPIRETLSKLIKTVGWKGLLNELYYAFILRMNKNLQNYLQYFRVRSSKEHSPSYIPKVLEVDSVNGDDVYELLQKAKPELLILWGTTVIAPRIFQSAKHAINLHMGLGEHYRGAVANHFAILHDEHEKIGATIHYVHEKVDTGDVLDTIVIDEKLPPKELFTRLNDLAEERFLEIALLLWKNKKLDASVQNIERSRNILLREWTPSRRYAVARKLRDWEEGFKGRE